MNTPPQFAILAIARLHESPTNPRRHFKEGPLAELAENVKRQGVLVPLLTREDASGYEIIAGARRFRAAQLAGLVEVPARICIMDDATVREVQVIENLQREDVHPLEEAEGFAGLLEVAGCDAASVADRIGRPVAYVRGRLKLLDLSAGVRDAFAEDRITIGHARLIAGMPEEKQAEALAACFRASGYGKNAGKTILRPVSDLRDWISEGAGVELDGAPFSLEDAGLVAEAGACVDCSKCTLAEGKLFPADANDEDTCFDRECFDGKVAAQIAKLAAGGMVQVSTGYQEKKAPAGTLPRSEYTRIEVAEPDEDPEEGDETCPHMEDAVIADGNGLGTTMKICRNPECPVHGEPEVPPGSSSAPAEEPEWKKQQREDNERARLELEGRKRAFVRVMEEWAGFIGHDAFRLLLVLDQIERATREQLQAAGEKYGITLTLPEQAYSQPVEAKREVQAWAQLRATALQQDELLIALLLEKHVERRSYDHSEDLLAVAAEECGLNFAAIQAPPADKPVKATKKKKGGK